eukprot:5022313-Pleurochrysis_carterae.AAC.4
MIESRGAKLKKLGRRTVSWRPLKASKTVCNYVDRQTGRAVRRAQKYRSSPMEHMCLRMLMIEVDLSHNTSSVFARAKICTSSSNSSNASSNASWLMTSRLVMPRPC